ncbi:apolipoprotein N-acyltransferase [Methylovorus sp. MM2]|uniref:apolipoprotein N-acyltransferase n=1 Tax=Methylovorus sp. MM2 TaxID=1848038 RepID=UPI0020B7A904|nr:apolipoprotein N-acyltransferase [Methylovorus sp. MM2]
MRTSLLKPCLPLLLMVMAGAISILGYAPFYLYPLPIISLTTLFYYIQKSDSATKAAWLGFSFGLGFFCAGVSWIYISLHDFGGMPFAMAAFATFAFCAFLSLFTAAVGFISKKLPHPAIALPILWVVAEWIRSWIFTGFPWLNVGYSQIPYSPLAGFAPALGVYGVSLLTALVASLILLFLDTQTRKKTAIALTTLFISGISLQYVTWSKPEGDKFSVALLQGNIAQDMKWDAAEVQRTLDKYYALVTASNASIIVMPETAFPMLVTQLPEAYIAALKAHAVKNQGDIIIGAVEYENEQYYNSMLSIGSAETQVYRKSHLVPFGEFIPLKSVFGWIYRDWLNIPLTDLARGDIHQQPIQISGKKAALNICYEDVFGEEIIRQLPQAGILINASNDAWYGESLASYQHLQMSQMRALETGRMMLRATNTGATAVIGVDGKVISQLPHFETGVLEESVQSYSGTTPYVRFGNWPVLLIMLSTLGLLWVRKKK